MSEQGNEFNLDDKAGLQNDDVEGHRLRNLEDDEDVEGHRLRNIEDDEDDVEGHRLIGTNVQPPRDADLGGTER